MSSAYDYRVNTHVSTRLKGVLNNATVVRDTSVLTFEDASYFPQVGRVTAIYVDSTNNVAYRWNDTVNQYIPLDGNQTSSNIVVTTGIVISYEPPKETSILWVDSGDSGFLKYFDGNLWRKSNIILLCNPEDINNSEWITIPDSSTPTPPSKDDEWITIPDSD